MVPRRRKLVVGALTLLSCSDPTLSFLPSTTHTAPVSSSRGLPTAAADPARSRHRQRREKTRVWPGGDQQEQVRSSLRAPTAATRRSGRIKGLRMMAAAAAAAGADDGGIGASAAPAAPADAPISSSSGIATPTAPLQGNDDNDDIDDDELPLTLDKALEEGVNRAMRGDTGVLRQVLAPGVEWRGPLGSNVGLAKVEEELRGLGNLLSDPRMSVSASLDGARRLEWIGSGTWRLPWLPRFIVRGASTIETGADGKVCLAVHPRVLF